jgi:Uma2 family endonuclease
MSASDYLAWEREQPERHELFGGEVFAMAGGTPRHNALSAAIAGDLRAALRGGPCRVFSADQRIALPGGHDYVYADASVVCGPMSLAAGTTDVLANPSVVVEVLSKSTEAYDRGLKWDGYQQIPSVVDYLLVSQRLPRIEHYRREAGGEWHYRVASAGDRITLEGGTTLDVDALYAGVFDLAGE